MAAWIAAGFVLAVAIWTAVGRNLDMPWMRAVGFGLSVAVAVPLASVAPFAIWAVLA